MSHFSDRLISRRTRLGLSQEQLAEKAGLSLSSISALERDINPPTLRTIEKLGGALDINAAWLMRPGDPDTDCLRESAEPFSDRNPLPRRVRVMPWSHAGSSTINYNDPSDSPGEWLPTDCPDPDAYALVVEGDSMAPEFKAGDRIILAPNTVAVNGDVVIVRLKAGGQMYFRLFHLVGKKGEVVRLTSFNPAYPALEFTRRELSFIHPMQWAYRKWRR